jgi:F420-dependent oxidoreductase-like protein
MTFPLRFGIGTGNRKPFPELVRNWQMIEHMGFDTAWVVDHFLASADEDIPYMEAWTLITALGMMTNRLRFGILVSCNTFRNPGLLAKQAVTADHASNGRVELGIGAGWMEREHEAYGIDLMPVGERVSMFEESLQVIRSLMTQRRTSFNGKYYTFVDAPFEPKPVQERGIPILVGAFGHRTIGIAGRHADNWNTRAVPEEAEGQVARLRSAAEKAGRDPDEIRCSVFTWEHPFKSEKHFRDVVLSYREIGITDFQFPMPEREEWEMMERCARNVMPELRRMT